MITTKLAKQVCGGQKVFAKNTFGIMFWAVTHQCHQHKKNILIGGSFWGSFIYVRQSKNLLEEVVQTGTSQQFKWHQTKLQNLPITT